MGLCAGHINAFAEKSKLRFVCRSLADTELLSRVRDRWDKEETARGEMETCTDYLTKHADCRSKIEIGQV